MLWRPESSEGATRSRRTLNAVVPRVTLPKQWDSTLAPEDGTLYVESRFHGPVGIRAVQVTNQITALPTTRF